MNSFKRIALFTIIVGAGLALALTGCRTQRKHRGNQAFADNVDILGATTMSGNLTVTGDLGITGDTTQTGTVAITGAHSATTYTGDGSALTGLDFEDIDLVAAAFRTDCSQFGFDELQMNRSSTVHYQQGAYYNFSQAHSSTCEYNTAGTFVGYLTEKAATNTVLQSRTFSTTWVSTNASVAANETGITGASNSAYTLTTSASDGDVSQQITSSGTGTFSIFVKCKSGGCPTGAVEIRREATDVWTSATDISGSLSTSAWYRATISNANTNPYVGIRVNENGGEVIIDQAQDELRSGFATSPIFTTIGTVTRNAPDFSYHLANVANLAKGTVVLDFNGPASPGSSEWLFAIGEGGIVGDGCYGQNNTNGGQGNKASITAPVANTTTRIAMTWDNTNQLVTCYNRTADESATASQAQIMIPPQNSNQGGIGNDRLGSNPSEGHITNLHIFRTILTTAQMDAL